MLLDDHNCADNETESTLTTTLIHHVRQLGSTLQRHSEQAEVRCRLSVEVVDGLREAGLFRLGVPQGLGGYEVDLATALPVIAEVARFCPSSAWIVALTYSLQQAVGSLPASVHREIWGPSLGAVMCGAFKAEWAQSVAVDGGLLVSGRWSWVSGCHHADWAWLAVPATDVADRSDTKAVMALLPVDELTVLRTWNMVGMRGTGSDTLEAESVFVPHHRMRGLAEVFDNDPKTSIGPVYRVGLGSIALAIAAPMLGAARAVLDEVITTIHSGKPMAMSVYRSLAEAPTVQVAVADAVNLIDSSHLHLTRSAQAIAASAEASADVAYVDRARVRMDIAYASESLRRAVGLLMSTGGAGAFALSAVAQRHWRDLETAARHPMLNSDLFRLVYGRALLGNEEPLATVV